MSKNIYYRYNPETDNYERVYISVKARAWQLLRFLLFSSLIGAALFIIAFYVFNSPGEKNLRKENSELKSQYNILNKRIENSLKMMDNIRQRDDNFYRVMMQMEPLSISQLYAGLDNDNRYKKLQSLSEAQLITELTRQLDLLDRQLYAQSLSFDELKSTVISRQDMLEHIPSVLPLNIKNYTMASGYGYRSDPIYGTTKFHEGLDFAATEGTPVFATANGTVTESKWMGSYGQCVEIDHGNNYVTRYAHLSRLIAIPGQKVSRGEKIGEVGTTGKSTGPHLHYEVRLKNEPQNPVNYYFMDITPAQYDEMISMAENAGHVMD
jgi:murein DD-endopeptidase MepM/ murein hydrolase activator NlpD